MADGRLVVSYRPTLRQLMGRTVFTGVMTALGAVAALVGIALTGARSAWVYLVFLPLVAVLVFVVATELSRHGGVDATEHGLRRVTLRRASARFVPWHQVADISTERRGWRTIVVVTLRSGGQWRLRAPYDSRWLSHDPDFEPKLFRLRNLWETYRTWSTEGSPIRRSAPDQ